MDVDGTLTDGNCYYSEAGEQLKVFSHKDGRGIYLLNNAGVKTAMITSEKGGINKARAKKLIQLGTLNYFFDGEASGGKLDKAGLICSDLGIDLGEVAFIGDDTNDQELISAVGFPAVVGDYNKMLNGPFFYVCKNNGGHGAVREFIDYLFEGNCI